MKNLLLLLMLWGAVPFCKAAPVHLKKAKQIAAAYTRQTAQLRNVAERRMDANVAGEEEVFEPLYVFNRGQNEGFVIVSGDDRLPQVLGYTDAGDFVEEEMPPALLDMLDSYRATVNALKEKGEAQTAVAPKAVEGRVDVAPLIQTHWHQSAPYNNQCPMLVQNGNGRALTGCTATAASQIIYYWHKDCPDRSLRATPTYSYGDAPVTESVPAGTPLKWDLMQLQYGSSYPAEMGDAVAMLMLITGTTLWQTYGNSTSGELPKLLDVFGGQYALNAKYAGKWSYSTAAWEKLIYDELAEGRPIEYAGSHPTNGGHAIVLDGYRAADNLFHFNFGWGGQGDGYYTLDDANGVNGFSQSQHMVYGISPKTLNLEAGIVTNKLVKGTTNTVRVQFTNNSTLPYTGIYLFCLTGTNKPAGISKATRSDTKTVIPTGRTLNVDFEFKPSSSLDYTVYVVDKNNRVLAQKKMVSEASVPDLALQAFEVNTNGETVTESIRENGADVQRAFSIVQYTDAVVRARMRNGAGGTFCEPGLRCFLYAYNAEQGGFEQVKTSIQSSTTFRTDEVRTVEFPFARLSEDKLYKACFSDVITNNITYTVDCSQADTVVYFRVKAPSLTAVSTENGEMAVSGKWNADAFRKLATDASVCRYDLTAVEGLNEQPEAANRNALFYVADDAAVAGTNIVRSGVCDDLQLETGYDFVPRTDFTARRATYLHKRPAAQWNTLVLPFDCDVPDGIMARRVTKLMLSYIYECDSVNLTLKSGTPYLYIAGAPCHDRFTATDVTVSVNVPGESTDSLRGTFVNLPATEGMYVLADGENQSFVAVDGGTVEAFTAYMEYNRAVAATSYPYRQKDQLTLAIARLLTEAYELLEEQADNVDSEATADLLGVVAEVERQFRLQPEYGELRKMQMALNEAMAAYASARLSDDDGLHNLTALLKNPSFESGNLSGWDIEEGALGRPAASRITSSLANYMSGADGSYVLYAPMSGGGSASVSQTVEGLENGFYRVEASVASDTGNCVELFANGSAAQVEIDDFGPMYLREAVVESVEVTDGALTLGVRCEGSWYKVDNFRLYYVGRPTGIACTEVTADGLHVQGGQGCIRITAEAGNKVIVCDMSGRVVAVRTVKGMHTVSGLPAGTYLVNRHKVMVY